MRLDFLWTAEPAAKLAQAIERARERCSLTHNQYTMRERKRIANHDDGAGRGGRHVGNFKTDRIELLPQRIV